jgi:hypothetical protein
MKFGLGSNTNLSLVLYVQSKERFVFSIFDLCKIDTINFDVWMSRGSMDTFVHIIKTWFFETMETFVNVMPLHVNEVFAKHGLNVWVKNERRYFSSLNHDHCFDIFGFMW